MRVRMIASVLLIFGAAPAAAETPVEKGTVRFQPVDDQKSIPERYRLEPHSFVCQLRHKRELTLSRVNVYELRFPSPVESKTPENNTVWAEYYRPHGDGPFPCVIVLDITGGDQTLSRTIASILGQNRIAALFVQMAYYGPRRPAGSKLRLLSFNVAHTVEAVRQTVLDIRRATAWMESRPELDRRRLGILGTSLGSFVSALAGEMEPKLTRVGVMLGGGGLVDAYWEDPRVAPLRRSYELLGGNRDRVKAMIAPADPITCAANLRKCQLLIIAASRDEIVPPRAATTLWEASGKQKIVWYNTTHYGAALYFPAALKVVIDHFGAPAVE